MTAVCFFLGTSVFGGQFVGRVVEATPESLVVIIGTETRNVRLAGTIQIAALTDEWREKIERRLTKELRGKFVMLEAEGAAYRAFRSPDALFINEWLVAEGLADAAAGAEHLARVGLKARVTGQGWWSTGNSISSAALTSADYIGQLAPAGRKSAPRLAPPPHRPRSSSSKGRGRKR